MFTPGLALWHPGNTQVPLGGPCLPRCPPSTSASTTLDLAWWHPQDVEVPCPHPNVPHLDSTPRPRIAVPRGHKCPLGVPSLPDSPWQCHIHPGAGITAPMGHGGHISTWMSPVLIAPWSPGIINPGDMEVPLMSHLHSDVSHPAGDMETIVPALLSPVPGLCHVLRALRHPKDMEVPLVSTSTLMSPVLAHCHPVPPPGKDQRDTATHPSPGEPHAYLGDTTMSPGCP